MSLIDGVGDEVIQFLGVVVVLFVGALAWCSTNARPVRYRTLLVMRLRTHHPVTVSIRARPNTTNTMQSGQQATNQIQPTSGETPSVGIVANATEVNEDNRDLRVLPLQEMDSIVDADMALLDHNRLHFYRRIDTPEPTDGNASESSSDEVEATEESGATSNAQIREMDSIVSAMEADVATVSDWYTPEPNSTSATADKDARKKNEDKNKDKDSNSATTTSNVREGSSSEQGPSGESTRKILIKLKYLNDTLKEVEGSLDELLKDFKWRHFSVELSSMCRVRLIFNGRALSDDATLRACGLHDRAVVHCLVHPNRNGSQGAEGSGGAGVAGGADGVATGGMDNAGGGTGGGVGGGAGGERVWDLENILMTLVSVALTVVWFFRCEYSNMFTASASVALFGLTVFYSVAIFGLYLSDTFHFDRPRAPHPQPVPTN